MRPIITLSSDMGRKDPYLAQVKGTILSYMDDCNIIDLSHEIKTHDIIDAAYVLAQSYKSFPKGSIHILGVASDKDLFDTHILMEYDGHFFVGPNNGVFSLINYHNDNAVYYRINPAQNRSAHTFAMKNIYVPVACHIAQGGDPSVIGSKTDRIDRKIFGELIQRDQEIVGEVIYIDHYDNIITNVKEATLLDFIGHHLFQIQLKNGRHNIDALHRTYGEVPEGQLVALIGDHGFLEIAMNRGSKENGGASSLLGLKRKDKIRVSIIAGAEDSLFG